MKNLIAVAQLPQIPPNWNYEESVAKVQPILYKWKSLTIELVTELWVAREILALYANGQPRSAVGTFVPADKSWTTYCQEIGSSRQVINRWLAIFFPRQIEGALEPLMLPIGVYDVIYADPPWQYDNAILSWGPASLHYPSMRIEDLCAMTIPVAENAVLFLWTTNPFLQDALTVVEAWGFDYKTNMVWVKTNLQKPGSGFYVRGRHELLFIATKGSFVPDQRDKEPIGSIIMADVREHSQKPDAVYDIIEAMYPEGKYLELFARGNTRDKWMAWGNEANKV